MLTMLTIHKSMSRPILEYGSTVWDPHCNGLNDELENVEIAEINTHWSFRFLLLVKMPTRNVSFPKLSGTEMSSLILSSPLLNCQTNVCLNLLPL